MKSSMQLCLLVRHMENVSYWAAFIQRPKEFTTTYFAIHITVVLSLVVSHFIISFPHSSHLSKLPILPFHPHPPSFQMKTNNTSLGPSLPLFSHCPQGLLNQENATNSVYGFFQGLWNILTISLCIRWTKMWDFVLGYWSWFRAGGKKKKKQNKTKSVQIKWANINLQKSH